MRGKAAPAIAFNAARVQEDMVNKGWSPAELARRAKLSHMTIHRFLQGKHQTSSTARALAKALGYSVRRYLVASPQAVAR